MLECFQFTAKTRIQCLQAARRHITERPNEFAHVIAVLTKVLGRITGAFILHALSGHSDRSNQLIRMGNRAHQLLLGRYRRC